ncbi:MAG: hypothetical protein AAGF31_06700 [Planctomycetota bacterium]
MTTPDDTSRPDQPLPQDGMGQIKQIHAAPSRGVLAVTGGGSGAISRLLQQPGASRTVLEAVVPYSWPALEEWLGGRVDSACSEPAARAMAMAAYTRARRLASAEQRAGADDAHLFGIGCTASLASDRPKRGDHRLHVALQTRDQSLVWSLTLAKGRRSRGEEETEAERLVLHAVAVAAGLAGVDGIAVGDGDSLAHRHKQAPRLWVDLLWRDRKTALVNPKASEESAVSASLENPVLFPGSFAPPHRGHQRMAEIASARLQQPVTLEVSVSNVDKPPLDYLAIEDRLAAIAETFPNTQVLLTRLPTFLGKARQFQGSTFVVGADTLLRIAAAKYYDHSEASRDAAIAKLKELGCRFLVFGRQRDEEFETLADLAIPSELRNLCDGVSAANFREDISSTAIREQRST